MDSLDACLRLDDAGQNRAIYCIMKQIEAGQEIDRETISKLDDICKAVQNLSNHDIERGARWKSLDHTWTVISGIAGGIIIAFVSWIIRGEGG
jgi:hypothetical protein